MPEEYESDIRPCARSVRKSDFNEMAAAVAAAISVWALATLIAVIAGYHGSGATNTINLLVMVSGGLGFVGRRWQLGRR
ncbi:hypothetical protein QE444_002307 [Pseudomonas sp. SORGH_AS199]|jgi:hypothetical protein|uniref:hypothetical protein n=1 Tax=Pseudomonas sp. SORGH_AS_0199 TaxID=3041761 RepID=UPI00285C65A8|nr:hypothetical protein [Pseudomonas sp. SORGH_AS_0199]MDR6229950.1 hypothetical protein [Pseudomonas sp. SORGH_AS_0199]